MSTRLFELSRRVAASAILLAACSAENDPGRRFVAGIAAVDPQPRSLAAGRAPSAATAVVAPVNRDQVLAWAQLAYPDLFPGVPAVFANVVYEGKSFSGRAYANGNYLAVADGRAYGLGPFTNQQLTDFGSIQTYSELVCAQVDCGRSGPANPCAPPVGEVLRTDARTVLTHRVTTLQPAAPAREVTTESVVDGPVTFGGLAAVKVTTTQRDAQGLPVGAASVVAYRQALEGGLVRTLGTDSIAVGSGQLTRVLFEPALAQAEFSLQPGESLTQVQNLSTSTAAGAAVVSLSARTHTFEARERIDVLGRSYDTCRYRDVALGTTAPARTTWAIVGSGLPARIDVRDAAGGLVERAELQSGSVNGAPLAPGQATMDARAAERLVSDYAYVLPICSPGGAARTGASVLSDAVRKALDLRKTARVLSPRQPRRRALAYTATRPADQLGDCGGRLSYPSYSHANGVTTATMRWDGYCTRDPDSGGSQVIDGSWSFVETASPTAGGPVVTRYEGGSSGSIAIVDRDRGGRTIGSQVVTVVGYVSTPGVPGGDSTSANPDRLQAAEWQVRNVLTGKLYRQTDYRMTSFMTPDGGEQLTVSGRGYRSTGFFELRTTAPIVTDADGNYVSGVLSSVGADGSAIVMTVRPGEALQATMTVDGTPVTTAPACR